MPAASDQTSTPGTWLVYTDGSCRHERRQTFCGWAARAVQPATRQVLQVSGAVPGGDSLWAESEAIHAGLRLLPAGASALLHSDLELQAIQGALRSPAGEAARAHLCDVFVQPVLRNTGVHQAAMHRASRAAEQGAREAETNSRPGSGVQNAAAEARELSRSAASGAPLSRAAGAALPGVLEPWKLRLEGVRFHRIGAEVRAQLQLDWPEVEAGGRSEREALQRALHTLLTPLARASIVHLHLPAALHADVLSVVQRFPTVQLQPSEGGDAE
ncbi:hypothetical protein [Deinococcus peraridilitoris]|uniref:Uncharacterized protein n=1 Tax=Deinococcus peraridilitoris (strain DSM 19664 / LMG 22246 / CIP 109416 / KR-200) TaxID=937777 RepID=L0A3E4_DEIPD|nr:hypothetical protein [Deinococcus peraridilitoris]AFZ67530.1 hypothetical protein Deipe_2033 [Deinococcus peraridilitoris DSM 19664]